MEYETNRKPLMVLVVAAVLLLVAGVAYFVVSSLGPRVPVSSDLEPVSPAVVTEPGNPRAVSGKLEAPPADNVQPSMPVEVKITDFGYEPAEVNIPKYSVVTFTNEGSSTHSVKGESGKWGSLIDLEPGKAYSQQFDVSGTYRYYDPLNPDLTGVVIVK